MRKKLIVTLVLMSTFSYQAQSAEFLAGWAALYSAFSLIMTTTGGPWDNGFNKSVLVAAKDSAVMYIASNGEIPADALLQDALSVIGNYPEAANLSELEKAKLIVILTEETGVK